MSGAAGKHVCVLSVNSFKIFNAAETVWTATTVVFLFFFKCLYAKKLAPGPNTWKELSHVGLSEIIGRVCQSERGSVSQQGLLNRANHLLIKSHSAIKYVRIIFSIFIWKDEAAPRVAPPQPVFLLSVMVFPVVSRPEESVPYIKMIMCLRLARTVCKV